jgi:uncharacterized paraquat-inducible protein A
MFFMKKVEKFLKHISKLEVGSAPSVGYFEQIILEARESLEEFEQLRQHNVEQSELLVCPCCGSDKTYKTDAVHCSRCAVTTEI